MFRSTTEITCECRNCPGGRYNPAAASFTAGRIDCDACPEGHFASDAGTNAECTACEAGKFTDERVGLAFCLHCSAGMRGDTSNDGVPTCTACGAGHYQQFPGKTTCDACECGKYTTYTGSVQCDACDGNSAEESTCSDSCTAVLGELPPLPAFSFVDFATTDLTIGACQDNLQDAQAGLQELTGKLDSVDAATTTSGLVHIDINHDGSVDVLDAMTLFVAQTMQDFGAAKVITHAYDQVAWSGDRSIDQIIAEVSTAMHAASAE
jgi:hypothetical protein